MPDAFGLYVILTDPLAGYEACAEAAVAEGVRFLQLRMKAVPREEVVRTARLLRPITRGTGTLLIVNDDVFAAAEADADGVHLGQGDMPLEEARRAWAAPGKLFGLSTHDEEQELRARALRPDYIGVGPVFPTPTKQVPDPVLGPERMGRIIRASPLTAVAIGGITEENLPQVLAHGAVNFCAVRPICRSTEPRLVIRRLMAVWRACRGPK